MVNTTADIAGLKRPTAEILDHAYAVVGSFHTHFNKLLDRSVDADYPELRRIGFKDQIDLIMAQPDGKYRVGGLLESEFWLIEHGVHALTVCQGYEFSTMRIGSNAWTMSVEQQLGTENRLPILQTPNYSMLDSGQAVLNYFYIYYLISYCGLTFPPGFEESIRPTVELSVAALEKFNHINNTLLRHIGEWQPKKREV